MSSFYFFGEEAKEEIFLFRNYFLRNFEFTSIDLETKGLLL